MHYHIQVKGTLLLAAVLVILAGCRGDDVSRTEEGELVLGSAEVEEVMQRGVAPGNRVLLLDGFSGNVQLTGAAGTTAELAFVKRARGRDTDAARRLLGEVTIEESGDGETYRYVMTSEEPGRTAVDVRGTAPQGARLRIQLENGNVELSGMRGVIEVEQSNGTVRIGGAAGNVTVENNNGAIEVGFASLPADASVRLTAANGNITLTLPGTSAARVRAETSAGSINVGEGLAFSNRQLEPQAAGSRFNGQLGRGTASVEITTQNGSITLREGTVASVGTAEAVSAPPDTARVPGR